MARRLNPNDADILGLCGMFLAFMGRAEEGLELLEYAYRRNPFALGWYLWNEGITHYTLRDYKKAIVAWRGMAEPPTEIFASLSAAYAQLGAREDAENYMAQYLERARAEFADFPGDDADKWRAFWSRSYPYKNPDDLEHLLDGLRKAGLCV
jgi:tetratricopeptide (TPR) repeat protein